MHYIYALITDKKYEYEQEISDKFRKSINPTGFMIEYDKNSDIILHERMEKEVINRMLKYVKWGICDEWDEYLRSNKLIQPVQYDDEWYFENPNAFWDWFRIIGRGYTIAEKVHYKQIKELDIEDIVNNHFYGFIDLQDNVKERGELESPEEDIFIQQFRDYLTNNPDLYIIVVDFHN